MTSSRPQVTRRTIAIGAAWAVPVIAVGAPVPAMAASGCLTGTVLANPSQFADDEITVTNSGPGVVTAGSLVNFTIQNMSDSVAFFYQRSTRGTTYVGTDTLVPPRSSRTFQLVVDADIVEGGTAAWSFELFNPTVDPDWASFTYVPNNGPAGCGSIQGCASKIDFTYGFDCPAAP